MGLPTGSYIPRYYPGEWVVITWNDKTILSQVQTAIGSSVCIKNVEGGIDPACIRKAISLDFQTMMTKLERLIYGL